MREKLASIARKAYHKGVDLYNVNIHDAKWLKIHSKQQNVMKAYKYRNYDSNIKTSLTAKAIDSRKKDMYIERLLNEGTYTIDKPLVIKNPYKISILTLLVVFNTKEKCRIEYTVKGQKGSKDFTAGDGKYTTRHRVPVVALFPGCTNVIILSAYDKNGKEIAKKKIKVIVEKIDRKIAGNIEFSVRNGESSKEFFFVSGGYKGGAYMFDSAGNIRWALSEIPMHYGVYLFENGRFLFPELRMRRPVYGNAHSVVTHEMDMMGRVYHTYYHPKGFHHWACEEEPLGNILTVSSSLDDTYMENVILELDRKTGESIHELSMNDVFDETYVTRNDWVHLNAMDYIPEENAVIACMRNIHTIAKISLDNYEIKWIMCNPEFFKGTEQQDKVLKPEGKIDWYFQQHGVKIIHEDIDGNPDNLHITFYDNHAVNRRPVDWYDGDDESSYACVYTIDEKEGTFRQDKRFKVPVCSTRCNNEFYPKDGRMFVMCARLRDNEKLGCLSKIVEFDYESGEIINEISLEKDFFTAHCTGFNIADMSEPLPSDSECFLGQLYEPKEVNDYKEAKDAPVMPDSIASEITFRMMGDVMQLKAHDHDIEHIFVYDDEKAYMQDFTDSTQPLEIFKAQSYFVSMPLDEIPVGEYRVAVKYKGEYYNTPYNINITTERKN